MIEIPCHCGRTIGVEIDTEIDLALKPEIYSKIIDGDFMTFKCPECGSEIRTEIQLRLHDYKNDIDIEFLPELERGNYLAGHIESKAKRVAIGYKELVEKIVIAGEKLDDRIIEIIKFRLLEKAGSNNINIYFNNPDAEELVFHVYGLKPDQVGISRVPMSVYHRIENELDQLLANEEIKLFTEGPYISVSRIYLEE